MLAALISQNKMDGETKGLSDWFLARHTRDPALLFRLLSNRNRENSTSNRSAGRFTEVNYVLDIPSS